MICFENNSFSQKVKEQFIEHFALDSIEELDGYTSHVFIGTQNGKKVILKISHSSWETFETVCSEKKLIDYLSSKSVSCARMISEPQKMIDEKDGYFTGRLYEFLEGEILEEMEYSSSQMTELGNQLGLFHKNACDLDIQRDSLDTAPYFNFKKYVPSDQTSILESFQTLMNEINAIERTPETWGLTHGDCHPGNVMARGNNLTLIDFNDSGFNYFLNDIAIVLYMTFPPEDVDEKEFMMTAFKDFMKGYRQHMNPSAEVLDKLPLFFKLRTLMFHTLEAWMFPFYSKEEQEEAKAGIEKRIKRVESDFESLKYMFEIPFSKL